MSLVDYQFFSVIHPYIIIQRYVREGGGSQNPRYRIEIKSDIPSAVKRQALAFEMPCVACGAVIHPFRQRGPARRGVNIGNLYYAACCPLAVRLPCSRGEAASVEYRRIAAALANRVSP
ncbi:MAG TPA: hypothetical protein VH187_01460 [Scandinavium sp.]|jgi:hypothetical protein|uniref:hypothetical protein n=1 Tax=Scandinavium sp. TaxID=2830653 RepID=UPI002E3125E9|nr:hypothetical protein [Scandinavium sp.]HEX4499825.1 hypothetical protein [Scandinavium sp.]